MSRLIDADKLIQEIEKYHVSDGYFQHWVEVQPTIEPRCETCEAFNKTRLLIPQPERKKGKWINEGIYGEGHSERAIRCSNCDWHYIGYLDDYKYCPNCGADMRGDEHEDD